MFDLFRAKLLINYYLLYNRTEQGPAAKHRWRDVANALRLKGLERNKFLLLPILLYALEACLYESHT